ncbi:hypothetical protein AB8615_07910 [Litorimonas sp. RW-G-Af-16]|uniref:hypothetical protein n=1 Tax=Litorimonas sp. RW-G-Af-16 TaxID=3241168 RepID=UPI003AAABD82
MTKLLKTAAIAALITGFANTASALEITNPLDVPGIGYELLDGPAVSETRDVLPALSKTARIGVARIDGGSPDPNALRRGV